MAVDFGQCPCRAGVYRRQEVQVRSIVPGQNVLMTDVDQGVCDSCGSRVYKLDTLRRIEAVVRGDRRDPIARMGD